MNPGSKFEDPSGIAAIVVRAGAGMSLSVDPSGPAAVLGKRYQCAECGAEVLVSSAGAGTLLCHGAPMKMAGPRQLPSAD
jgi:desulfoferrodoxin-like iron-binding protein